MKKYNLVVPLAGKGQRMVDGGYAFPKPMILAGDRHILDYGLSSIDHSECNLIFVVRRDHISNFSIDRFLISLYGNDIKIVVAEEDTDGSVSTCMLAKDLINNDVPLLIFCPDVYFESKFKPTDDIFKHDGFLLTFKANSPNYSYVQMDTEGFVTRTAEKIVISEDAAVGLYCYKNGKTFVEIADIAHERGFKVKNEFYICPLYNLIVERGGKVTSSPVEIMYIMGTPPEMSFFMDTIYPFMLPRSFIICSDHSGFELKEEAAKYFKQHSIPFINCGSYSTAGCDYSDFIAQAVLSKRYLPGALIMGFCRSGQGVNICANKHPGIISALVTNAKASSLAIRHNAANFFAISTEHTSLEALHAMIEVLKVEKFEGGRHQNRLQKLRQ